MLMSFFCPLNISSLLSHHSLLVFFCPSLYAFRGIPCGYLGRAQSMLTSAPFFSSSSSSSSFLGQPLLTHLLCPSSHIITPCFLAAHSHCPSLLLFLYLSFSQMQHFSFYENQTVLCILISFLKS